MLSVCIVGAGFSGICAGVRLQQELDGICSFTIFDQNEDFGGVWLKNTYPGCACEVPSHLYSFSFEQNSEWSESYAKQPEILDYIRNICTKHDLYSSAKFKHTVDKVVWDKDLRKWRVTVLHNGTVSEQLYNIVILAQGRFSSPEIPDRYRKFEGPIIHSGEWDHSVSLKGKNVLVVGCGASGGQIVPAIADEVNHLIVYQRHAPWVLPKRNFAFPKLVQWIFAKLPSLLAYYRGYMHWLFERNMSGIRLGSLANKIAPIISNFLLWRQVRDPSVREKLKPNYAFGCKRIMNSTDYYPTFNKPNVTLVNENITVRSRSVVCHSGEAYDVDIVVLATGFQVQNLLGKICVIGKSGLNLSDIWNHDCPKTYLSTMCSECPNLFFLLGPNASTGYTTILLQLESQVDFVIKAIRELHKSNGSFICPIIEAEERYMNSLKVKVTKTVFGSQQCRSCQSWYLNSKGDVIEIYPDSTKSYREATSGLNLSDFELC